MKVNKIREVKKDASGNITILHSNGTFHYKENDVALKEWTNSFFCRFNIDHQSDRQRIIFWNWVLSICFGLFVLQCGMELSEIPLMKRRAGFAEIILIGMNNWFYIVPLFLITYIGFRWIYFLRYRDFFSKDLVFISLTSNQNIVLKGERKGTFSLHYYTELLQEILLKTENIRVFDDQGNNRLKLLWEYIIAISILIISSYFVFSSWGENSLTNPFPQPQRHLLIDLSKKEIELLPSPQQLKHYQEVSKSIDEWKAAVKKWDIKFEKEQIQPHYFFLLGYMLPVSLGLTVFVGLFLITVSIFFLAYLLFWPVGYSIYQLLSRRDLDRLMNRKYIYPIIFVLFVSTVLINFIVTNNLSITLILFLIPLIAPVSIGLLLGFIMVLAAPVDVIGGFFQRMLNEIFTKRYWKFLLTGQNEYPSVDPTNNLNNLNFDPVAIIHCMIWVTWLIVVFHGFFMHSIFNVNNELSFTFNDTFFFSIIGVVFLRMIFRFFRPNFKKFGKSWHFNIYKNDFLSIHSLVTQNGFFLQNASTRLRDNEQIVLAAVKQNGLALQFASHELKNDIKIVLEAMKSNRDAFQFASETLKNDQEILALKEVHDHDAGN